MHGAPPHTHPAEYVAGGDQAIPPEDGHTPGIDYQQLALLVLLLIHGGRALGMDSTDWYCASSSNTTPQLTPQRLLRYIDDFLLITDDYGVARRFVDVMSRGFPEYGAFVSPGKTLLSFEHAAAGQAAPVAGLVADGACCRSR